jgi:hypothetical protein
MSGMVFMNGRQADDINVIILLIDTAAKGEYSSLNRKSLLKDRL